MNGRQIGAALVALAVVVLAGGLIWLSHSSVMPPVHTVQQAIPDDRIPR